MEFAKKQLEKYGWKEGEGLGKNKAGISKPLKPKLKFDSVGLGHDAFDDINNTWWQRLYDEAAKNIVTKKDKESVVLEAVEDSLEITTKRKKSKKKKLQDAMYKDFVKTAELSQNGEKKIIPDDEDEEPEINKKKKERTSGVCDLSEEELFKICGGRTLHKGARHGLKMNAKLARLEEQESLLEGQTEIKKRKKKRKKSENEETLEIVEESERKKHKKKKKHKKESD